MHAAMTKFPEGRQRWLNSAQEYERQADQLEAIDAKNTIGPASNFSLQEIGIEVISARWQSPRAAAPQR